MEKLNERADALRGRLTEYMTLLDGTLEDPSTLYLGENYFASMPLHEARAFLNRKVDSIRTELSALEQLSGVGEDGLPIFDIVEELDDNDNVVKSNLKRTGLGESQAADVGTTASDDSAFASTIKDEKEPIQGEPKSVGHLQDGDPMLDKGKILRPSSGLQDATESDFEHVETSGSFQDDDIQYIEDVTANEDREERHVAGSFEDNSQGEYRDIDPADILELELMEGSDEENIDFDFDHIEEEEENGTNFNYSDGSDDDGDDDDDDEGFGFGWQGGSLFPQDEATLKLIQAHLAQQDQSSPAPPYGDSEDTAAATEKKVTTTKKHSSNSHVHFADTVDVREFETSPSERKGVIYDRKPSRFSLGRSKTRAPGPLGAEPAMASKSVSPGKSFIAAAAAAAAGAAAGTPHNSPARQQGHSSSPVHGAVRERSSPTSHPVSSPTAARKRATLSHATGVTPAKAPSVTPKNVNKPGSSQTSQKSVPAKVSPGKNLEKPESPKQQQKQQKQKQPQTHKAMVAPKTTDEQRNVPEASTKEKIAQSAKEYYEDSFIPDVDFLKLHDTENVPPNDGPNVHAIAPVAKKSSKTPSNHAKGKKTSKENQPVVSSVVMEREPEELRDDSGDDSDNAPDMREIKHEYQRLRQKLIYESGGFKKKDSEKAVEPIEENGAPKKVSRFKAARVAS